MTKQITRGVQVKRWQLFANPWNPNMTTIGQQGAIRESIAEFDQVYDIVVCPHPDPLPALLPTPEPLSAAPLYQVIDGEHRMREYSYHDTVFVTVLSGYTLSQLQRLTVILNDTRGQSDPLLRAQLLMRISGEVGSLQAFAGSTYTEAQMTELIQTIEADAAKQASTLASTPRSPNTSKLLEPNESWIRQTFTYPESFAALMNVTQLEVGKHRQFHQNPAVAMGQFLEYLVVDYLTRNPF